MKKLATIVLLTLFSSQIAWGYGESLLDPTCELYLRSDLAKDEKRYVKKLVSLLEEKNYSLKRVDGKEKVSPGKLVVEYYRQLEDSGFYPPCHVEIILSKTKSETLLGDKKELFKKKVKRSHPRVSRKGISRCSMAVRDAVADLPKCVLQGN